ncbi:Protein GMH1 [Nakaseomyces glabratus]|nr:UNC-50 family [Nakaseomyces glabratus]KTB18779.1 Protein GMH1 [Nakaseomyces glabratus]KTB25422.1 Protein GMH1 [Nakaseomyces glabratus]
MSVLPTSNAGHKDGLGERTYKLNIHDRTLPPVLGSLFKAPGNLDFETAMWEMVNLILKPRKTFRAIYYQRQTKNQWARDDPSFFILEILLISISSVFWSLFYYNHSLWKCLQSIFNLIFVHFFLFGFATATFFWITLNQPRFKFKSASSSNIEWAYCFDVHCNAFLVILVALYYLRFLLLPLKFLGVLVPNTLFCASTIHYFILTFYGYSQLPFLKNISFILFPTIVLCILFVVGLFGVDIAALFGFGSYT